MIFKIHGRKKIGPLFNKGWTPYIVYLMLIIYIGIKPVSELLMLTYRISIRGVDFSMTLLIAAYFILKLHEIFKARHSLWYRLAFFTLVLIIITQVISYPLIISYGNQYIFDHYIDFFSSVTRFCVYLWIVGSNIDSIFKLNENKKIKLFSLVIHMAFVMLLFIYKSKYFINMGVGSGIFEASQTPSEYYLYYGDIFALNTLFVTCIWDSKILKSILTISGIYWLYMIGSRTSLYCFLIAIIFLLVRTFIKDVKTVVVLIAFISMAAYLISYNIESILGSNFLSLDNRMARAIIAKEEDDSYQSRQIQLEEGLSDIREFWLTGRFLREYERTGSPGEYIHNILSYWVSYGILPFLLIIILCIIAMYKNFLKFMRLPRDKLTGFVFCCSTFIISAAFTSRSYGYPYIWLAIAMSVRVNFDMVKNKGHIPKYGKHSLDGGFNEDMYAVKKEF